ncbi:hypothetical protein PIIN_11370 [Serendipita indica DSM 11827]|uniref:Uncharacterized protein n=1 Tax=Serendipita indica (strain DSM 11827) TaxID=1109443 RepID=G4U1F0_SERID|nr:hypothetical protein PIIN_11370 [Serendipita indica DSM 11827]
MCVQKEDSDSKFLETFAPSGIYASSTHDIRFILDGSSIKNGGNRESHLINALIVGPSVVIALHIHDLYLDCGYSPINV